MTDAAFRDASAHGERSPLCVRRVNALAVVKLRERKDLNAGTVAFTLLLMIEAYLGGEIGASPAMTAVHIPLAMALVALSVWLPFRATRRY